MKKYTYLFATLLVCLPVACNKVNEQEENPQTPTITYIKAEGNEEATKASIDDDDATFTWNTNDRIAVWADGYKISDPLASTYDATNSATFSFSGDNIVIEDERANFAIFPAKLVWDGSAIRTNSATNHDSDNMTITLPDTYTLEEVQGEVSPTPMIATNAKNGTLAFKHLCPLLRITVVNIPKQTKRIEFDFNDVNVQGEFTLSSVDPATTAITTEDGGTGDIITVTMEGNTAWRDQLVVNLPVPTGTYGNITITAYDAVSGGHSVLKLTKPIKAAGWSPSSRLASRKMTATLPVFTVDASGKKVVFAPGNLKATYDGTKWSWTFANIYSNVGASSGNIAMTASSPYVSYDSTPLNVDLFSWIGNTTTTLAEASSPAINGIYYSKDETGAVYGTSTTDVLKQDWGQLSIIDPVTGTPYEPGTWTTPDKHWFGYMMIHDDPEYPSRTVTNNLYANGKFVMVNFEDMTTKGLVIFPDTYSQPSGVTYKGTPVYNEPSNYTATVRYSGSDFQKMLNAGAVYLPAAGSGDGAGVSNVSSVGLYWTKNADDTKYQNAKRLQFKYDKVRPYQDESRRWNKFSVRLVRVVKD